MGPIGVLCLQGDFREHLATLTELGIKTRTVKKPTDLEGLAGLVIPGGESTVIDKLARSYELDKPIISLIKKGLPTFGTCAGLIMLANNISDGIAGQKSFGGLNVVVRRNAFGSQVESFEAVIPFDDKDVKAAFIRAPIVEEIGDGVSILSALPDGRVVAVRQGNVLGISFHPEITGEKRVHEYFVEMCEKANFKDSN